MKSVQLPMEMVDGIKDHISKNPKLGYESIAEFVRSAIRSRLIEEAGVKKSNLKVKVKVNV